MAPLSSNTSPMSIDENEKNSANMTLPQDESTASSSNPSDNHHLEFFAVYKVGLSSWVYQFLRLTPGTENPQTHQPFRKIYIRHWDIMFNRVGNNTAFDDTYFWKHDYRLHQLRDWHNRRR